MKRRCSSRTPAKQPAKQESGRKACAAAQETHVATAMGPSQAFARDFNMPGRPVERSSWKLLGFMGIWPCVATTPGKESRSARASRALGKELEDVKGLQTIGGNSSLRPRSVHLVARVSAVQS